MPYENAGDAYMNHAGAVSEVQGSRRLNSNHTSDDFSRVEKDVPNLSKMIDETVDREKMPTDTPTRDEIGRVMEWWLDKRDRMAEMFGLDARSIPAGAVWFLDIDHKLTAADIARGQRLAKELGLETKSS